MPSWMARASVPPRLTFEPGTVEAGDYRFDVGTAGSITLVLQACMLACARTRARTEFDIIGGTNVRMSPPSDYLEHVLFPLLRTMGYDIDVKVPARGFYPQGGGEMIVGMARGEHILPLDLEQRGKFVGIHGVCFTQKLPDHIAERMASTARKTLVGHSPVKLAMDRRQGHSIGAGIFLAAEYENTVLASDALGEKGISSEKLGRAGRHLPAPRDGIRGDAGQACRGPDPALPFVGRRTIRRSWSASSACISRPRSR